MGSPHLRKWTLLLANGEKCEMASVDRLNFFDFDRTPFFESKGAVDEFSHPFPVVQWLSSTGSSFENLPKETRGRQVRCPHLQSRHMCCSSAARSPTFLCLPHTVFSATELWSTVFSIFRRKFRHGNGMIITPYASADRKLKFAH